MTIMHFSKQKFLEKESKYIQQSELQDHWCHDADGRPVRFKDGENLGEFENCEMLCLRMWCN